MVTTRNNFSSFIHGVIFILVISQCLNSVEPLKILGIVPTIALSHFKFFQPILHGLADAGHDVTVYTHFPTKNASSNYHDIDLGTPNYFEMKGMSLSEGFVTGHKINLFFEFYILKSMYEQICQKTYDLEPIQKLINSNNEKYDVILVEYFSNMCLLGIAWKFQAPVIGLSSCALPPWHHNTFGTPMISSFMPSVFSEYSNQMTFSERFFNFLNLNGWDLLYRIFIQPSTNKQLRKQFGDDIPSIDEIERNASLIFVNTHYSMFGAKPYLPSIVEIGGVHMEDEKPIEPEMKKILDEATDGVLYFSWGSGLQVSTMHKEKLAALLQVFGSLKQKVLLKWESKDNLDNKPDNVILSKWFQQQDILCHPNVKAFFTHGGLMGSTEAIYCGTPVIVTPFFGDQFSNAAAFVEREIGHILPYHNITVESIQEAVSFALHPKTQEKAKKVSQAFSDRLNTPLDTAVWWVEHVAKTGGAPLIKSHGMNLNRFEYYSLDVILVLFGGLFLWTLVSIWVIRKVCCSKKTNTLKTNKQKTQ